MRNATTPTLDATIPEASGKTRLIEIHQLMTDFLRFQSHVQIPVYMDSPDWVENLEENEKEDHKKKLLRERQIIMMIGKTLTLAAENNKAARDAICPEGSGWETGAAAGWD